MYVDIYQALYRDRIMLVGNFLDEEQANSLIALLLFMRFEDPRKPISIYFNVPGALMKPCLAVYDTLRTLECPVTTVNLGLATGMGAFLCGAGTKGMRYALPNARFLMQRTGLDDPYQGQASDIGLMVRENLRDNDRMARRRRLRGLVRVHFRDPAQEKALVTMTGHPLEKIKKDMSRAVWKSFLGDDAAALASRRWRGGRRGDSGRPRREVLISTQVPGFLSFGARGRPVRLDRQGAHPAAEGHGRRRARARRRAELVRVREY